ncbi:hypothetical protein C8J57DRAFT_1246136 [Mycena rebaudengoi]|nr:hypothetical protein C8J57DRAFT_1246136 [Mycena rebaudengoi]
MSSGTKATIQKHFPADKMGIENFGNARNEVDHGDEQMGGNDRLNGDANMGRCACRGAWASARGLEEGQHREMNCSRVNAKYGVQSHDEGIYAKNSDHFGLEERLHSDLRRAKCRFRAGRGNTKFTADLGAVEVLYCTTMREYPCPLLLSDNRKKNTKFGGILKKVFGAEGKQGGELLPAAGYPWRGESPFDRLHSEYSGYRSLRQSLEVTEAEGKESRSMRVLDA